MIRNIRVPFGELNIFPFFMDYDFVKMRPRGLSTKFSFFSYGLLADIVENAGEIKDILFIKKETLYLKNGFFLVDYMNINEDKEWFIKKILQLNFETIYMEDSDMVNFNKLFLDDDRFKTFLLEIV